MLDLDAPEKIARWRPLVQWILAIPHLIVAGILGYVVFVIWVISFFTVLFTRRVPEGLHNFQVMAQRYTWRAYSYSLFMHDKYPPFDFPMVAEDPGDQPPRVSLAHEQPLNRWLPLIKWLLIIPHLIVLVVLALVAYIVGIIAFFAVIILGRYPLGLRDFLVGFFRWTWRVYSYIYFLNDTYPPFTLSR
jgi:hypothetical protein